MGQKVLGIFLPSGASLTAAQVPPSQADPQGRSDLLAFQMGSEDGVELMASRDWTLVSPLGPQGLHEILRKVTP